MGSCISSGSGIEPLTKEVMEDLRRNRRKGSYHLVSSRNRLPTDPGEEEEDQLFNYLTSTSSNRSLRKTENSLLLQVTKAELLRELAGSSGDTTSAAFHDVLNRLTKICDPSNFDARKLPKRPSKNSSQQRIQIEGMWIDLSKPKFKDRIGINDDRDYMYTLGRMTFDMFRPAGLVCSIQGSFNPVHFVNGSDTNAVERVPKSLAAEMKEGSNVLRTYDIVTAFTIEAYKPSMGADSPNRIVDKPIKALMTTYGYILPNPEKPNRITVWFTGGTIEVNEDEDYKRWQKVFDNPKLPKRTFKEKTSNLFAKVAMRAVLSQKMEEDGRMSYHLNRPLGGHDTAYVDILYLDETLRIARASSGVVYAFSRVQYFPDE